jgi:hypothetical protein
MCLGTYRAGIGVITLLGSSSPLPGLSSSATGHARRSPHPAPLSLAGARLLVAGRDYASGAGASATGSGSTLSR